MSILGMRSQRELAEESPCEWRHCGRLYIRGDLAGIDESRHPSEWWVHGTKYALFDTPGVIAGWLCCYDGCTDRSRITTRQSPAVPQNHMVLHGIKKAKIENSS